MADQVSPERAAWSAMLACPLERGAFRYMSPYEEVTWCRLLMGEQGTVTVCCPGLTVVLTLEDRSPGGRTIEMEPCWGCGQNALSFPDEAMRFRPFVADALGAALPPVSDVDLYAALLCVVTPHAETDGE